MCIRDSIGAIRAGAIGYLLKDTEADDLRRAIKAAAADPSGGLHLALSLIHI